MKRDWLLLAAVVGVTLTVALGAVRWFAPALLGIRPDLRVVQVSREVPPFYENVFRMEELRADAFHIQDPYVGTRHHPLLPELNLAGELGPVWGPEDLLGFRNRAVPIVADIVAIGDSQTFGSNATVDFNWPGLLARRIPGRDPVLYNMSSGGWGAGQYLNMFEKSEAFHPRVAVVAFYAGNDPSESVRMAYHVEPWASLRQGENEPEAPPNAWPPKDSELWPVQFRDGVRTVFTPAARLGSNDRRYPATAEGYAIMAEVARRIADAAKARGTRVVFTTIPTKELVFSDKVAREGLRPPEAYTRLVRDEAANIEELAAAVAGLPHATYVDVASALRAAAMDDEPLYLPGPDGHPVAGGYDVIARTLVPAVAPWLPTPPADGLVAVRNRSGDGVALALVRDDTAWVFGSPEVARANGWTVEPGAVPLVPARDLAGLVFRGMIRVVAPDRYGPGGRTAS